MKFLLAQKIGMSRLFDAQGNAVPVTLLRAGPVVVTQVKAFERDGYRAAQVGFGVRRKPTKPSAGHTKGLGNFRWLREVHLAVDDELKVGDKIHASVFSPGDRVQVRSISKGKGFQGVVKRHGFRGGWGSHGDKHMLRAPGSIGMSWPERVTKGRRMAGRMGFEYVTVKNLEVIEADETKNILALRGAVPGVKGTLVEIFSGSKKHPA